MLSIDAFHLSSRWRALVVAVVVLLAGTLLTGLATVTTLPGIGWAGQSRLALLFVPGFLVGWTSVPGERTLPLLGSAALYTLLFLLVWNADGVVYFFRRGETDVASYAVLGAFLLPVYVLAPAGLAIGLRALLRIPVAVLPTLSVLALSIALVIGYAWFVDGWRYIVAEVPAVAESELSHPLDFARSSSAYAKALDQATAHSLARGDLERSREILTRSLRLAVSGSAGVDVAALARTAQLAGADQEVRRVLDPSVPGGEERVLGLVNSCALAGDFACVRFFAAGLSDRRKFDLYVGVALGAEFQVRAPKEAIGELLVLADTDNCKRSTSPGVCPWLVSGGDDVYARIASVQGRTGFLDDALETVRLHVPPAKQFIALLELGQYAPEPEQAQKALAIVREFILQGEFAAGARDAALDQLVVAQLRRHLFDEAEKTAGLVEVVDRRQCLVRTIASERRRTTASGHHVRVATLGCAR
jgi:hypothetical protein